MNAGQAGADTTADALSARAPGSGPAGADPTVMAQPPA